MSLAPPPESVVLLNASEYDIYTVEELNRELEAVTPERRIVDFANVKYLDSTALGSLIRALKRLREQEPDATMTLINVSKQLYPLFEITRLDELFIIP